MPTINDTISSMTSETAYNKLNSDKTEQSDKDMFLSLMLQQMQNQDPTEPTDNQQWLAQLAQFSSLEQMTQMNEGLSSLASALESLNSNFAQNSGISQTLSLIGKEVDIVADPEKPDEVITGTVTEATFKDGEGMVKVNGKYYSIAYVQNIRTPGSASDDSTVPDTLPADEEKQASK